MYNSFPNHSRNVYKPKPPYKSVEGVESLAYEKLSCHAVWVLMEFYKRFNGFNRSNLRLSYEDVSWKIAGGTFNKALWELIGYGFLHVIKQGRLEKNNSIYGLSNRWKKLSACLDKIKKIEEILTEIEKVKHKNTPKNLSEEKKIEFRFNRRQEINQLRYNLMGA